VKTPQQRVSGEGADSFWLSLLLLPSSGNRYSTKTGYDGYVISEIVPPAHIVRLIDPHAVIKDTYDQGEWSYPAMPYSREKTGGLYPRVSSITRETTDNSDRNESDKKQGQNPYGHETSWLEMNGAKRNNTPLTDSLHSSFRSFSRE
jgi:hypothetical protein